MLRGDTTVHTDKRLRPALGAALVALMLMLTGCAADQASSAHKPSAPATSESHVPTADMRACAGAQGILGHVAADTAQWSPNRKPFQKAIAVRLMTQSSQLAAQAQLAHSADIRTAVTSTAGAFKDISAAMSAKNRAGVDRGINRSRVSYRELKRLCSLE
jgi:PBP1b-binding outer membrane lipoprotein LpoB